jgi:hypothetical protein
MADSNSPTGPAAPEIPITIHVDGNLEAVDFIRRLHKGGLQLRNADDGSYAVIGIAERPPQPVSGIRRQLFEASGIVHAVRVALDGDVDHDDVQLASALEAAGEMIDHATGKLEGSDHAF